MVGAGAVLELTVLGMGARQRSHTPLLLSVGTLGLGLPSWLHGTLGWSQVPLNIFFSSYFLSYIEHVFLMPLGSRVGAQRVQQGFHLTSQVRFWRAGPLLSGNWHSLALQDSILQCLSLQWLSLTGLFQESLVLRHVGPHRLGILSNPCWFEDDIHFGLTASPQVTLLSLFSVMGS